MKLKKECSITRDLLPYYLENLTSDTSNEYVSNHLLTCSECQKYKKEFLLKEEEKENLEKTKENLFVSFIKRKKYQFIGLFIGVTLTFLFIISGFFILKLSNPEKHTYLESVEDYKDMPFTGLSKLSMFPMDVNKNASRFIFDKKGKKLYQVYQILLTCSYSKEEYENEKKRLLRITDSETNLSSVYTEDENHFPMVYTMLYDEGYEYALLDEENRTITYIYLQGVNRTDLLFETDLLPKDYCESGMFFETEREGYSIYKKEY